MKNIIEYGIKYGAPGIMAIWMGFMQYDIVMFRQKMFDCYEDKAVVSREIPRNLAADFTKTHRQKPGLIYSK